MKTYKITFEEVVVLNTYVTAKNADDAENIYRKRKMQGEVGLEYDGDSLSAMDGCEIEEIIYSGVTDIVED